MQLIVYTRHPFRYKYANGISGNAAYAVFRRFWGNGLETMYRYSVDNAVIFTPEDLALFRESPFALWMERLTLENPDHGIAPDNLIPAHRPHALAAAEVVDTLRQEGRQVTYINPQLSEPEQRSATLQAMRDGADFIVGGMLAEDNLSGRVDMMMRTSGFSTLGDYLYIPCDTQVDTPLHSAFRLCFFADLLAKLQGQMPPQMLLIRSHADVLPLQTEEHIYYYQAVKQRFHLAMDGFRKHRMPDPAESAHFGRWAGCASDVLKQRAQSIEYQLQEERARQQVAQAEAEPLQAVAQGAPVAYSVESSLQQGEAVAFDGELGAAAPTLAEQARMLSPDSYRGADGPGRTPNLRRHAPTSRLDLAPQNQARRDEELAEEGSATSGAGAAASASTNALLRDEALENLAFIGSELKLRPTEQAASAADAGYGIAPSAPHKLRADAAAPGAAEGEALDDLAELEELEELEALEALEDLESLDRLADLAQAEEVEEIFVCAPEEPPPTEITATSSVRDALLSSVLDVPGEAPVTEPPVTEPLDELLAEIGIESEDVVAEAADVDELAAPAEDTFLRDASEATRSVIERAMPEFDVLPPLEDEHLAEIDASAPAPTLRDISPAESRLKEPNIEGYEVEMIDLEALRDAAPEPHIVSPDDVTRERGLRPHAGASAADALAPEVTGSFVDLDSAPPPTLMPVSGQDETETETQAKPKSKSPSMGAKQPDPQDTKQPDRQEKAEAALKRPPHMDETLAALGREFSSSLITSKDFKRD